MKHPFLFRLCTVLIQLTGGLLAAGLLPSALWANNAGGFVSTVNTSVTTGTEAFGSQTDHFLDNGILHVLVAANGNVDSIKFLQPGSGGTPKANGTEMVSQVGFTGPTGGFGNHTHIYYYWYPDSNGDAVYLSTTGTASSMDLACKRTYNPAVDSVPVDMEIHYVLGKGNTALYVYMVASHPASYAAYGNMSISFIQMIWPAAHDTTNFLCENLYVDSVKTGLTLNGTQLMRQAVEPNYQDSNLAVTVTGYPKEIMQMTTGSFSGQLTGKYSYTTDYWKLGVWGRASDVNRVGQWVLQGSHEYLNNGPTVCEYVDGWGLLYYEPLVAHYDNTGVTVSSTATWTKLYGPWTLYFNNQATGAAAWQDAKNQALAEQAAWPYTWLTNAAYPAKAQRASVTGKLVINDALRPGSSASGAWVGLVAPDSGAENAPDNWQFQSDSYQYWVQAAADGTFTIPNIQTTSPYGGNATYQLHAYSAGTSVTTGSVGEYSAGTVTITAGGTTNLGTLTWNVPHLGTQLVWEIGIPDRSAAEFKHGDEYGKPGLWNQFITEFTNPLEYNVADNNWATALNYCHSVDNMATSPWKWHVNFNLTSVNQGTYWLNIAYASPNSVQIIRVNDDTTAFSTFTPANADTGATTYIRQGIHSKYSVAHVAIPASKLHVGANTITLDHEYHSNHGTAHFMYDYINLESPPTSPPPPSSGRTLTWTGGATAAANTWDLGTTAAWTANSTATTFGLGDKIVFDDTGSNTTNTTVTGSLQPQQVTFNATRNYVLAGTGDLTGLMSLVKTGAGTVTLAPVGVALAGGNTTSGSAVVTTTGTTGASAGLVISGTGIPAGTKIVNVDSTTQLTLSQNATATAANGNLTFTVGGANTFTGPTTITAGTLAFGSDAANTNGLAASYVSLQNGTLTMYTKNNNAVSSTGAWNIDVPSGFTGTLNTDWRCTLTGKLTGGGTFNYVLPSGSVRSDLKGDWSGFGGQINVTTTGSSADFRMALDYVWPGLPSAALSLGAGVNAYYSGNLNAGTGTFVAISELSGTATSTLKGGNIGGRQLTYTVGDRGTDATFAGPISEQASGLTNIVKSGTGTWTLSGTNIWNGTTTVRAGTLRITGSVTNLASVTVTVQDTATLSLGGTLTAGTVQVAAGGTFTGNGTVNGSLNNSGLVSLSAGTLTVSGNVTNAGTLRLAGSVVLAISGTFTNTGVLDRITSTAAVPANLVNHGIILTSRAPTALTWTGNVSSDWDSQTTVNWQSATQPDVFFSGDTVTFDDTSANPSVNVVGTVTPAAVTASTSAGYVISGGTLGGNATLTKSGNGSLMLGSNLTYTGNTTVLAGTLALADPASPASTPLLDVRAGATLDSTGLAAGLVIGTAQTLRDTGNVTGNVVLNGIQQPGSASTVTGTLSYGATAHLAAEFFANATTAGTFDRLTAGNVTVSAGATLDLIFNDPGSTVDFTNAFWVSGHSWTVLTGASLSGSFTQGSVSADTSAQSSATYGNFSLQQSGSTVAVVWTPKNVQTITFAPLADQTYGAAPFAVSATASSGLAVSFSITGGPANISGNVVTLTGAGNVTVRAAQSGNSTWFAAANIDRSFSVAPASATVTLSGLSVPFDGAAKPVTVTTVPAGLAVTVTYNGSVTAPSNVGSYTVSAAVADPNYTGTASDTLVIRPDFASYLSDHFAAGEITDPNVSGPNANPAHDGMVNLLKYAFGLDPALKNAASGWPVPGSSAGSLMLSFIRRHDISDLTYTVEVSADLQTWNAGAGYTQEMGVVALDAQRDLVTVRDLIIPAAPARRFIRLRVTRP